ncbi:MAG: 4'-phosphopantetheinyl transferase superfamily protein [Gammaproteobacteria bacterium]|nr:4'-phosphopantetheinyl transferase superfamily protein [Pseudomonadales bacterium]MCP5346576.1 4'-phosphopantetheinyl transferase superfamily protein [Pseudomonadales bacterium]
MNERLKSGTGVVTYGTAEIQLWLLDLERNDPLAVPTGELILDEHEERRAQQFSVPEARQRYRLARTLVRRVLSACYAGVDAADWRFTSNAHGKPAVSAPSLPAAPAFNLSHCQSRVVLAVCNWPGAGSDVGFDLGVDVEKIVPRHNLMSVAKRYFSTAEQNWLCDLAPDEQLAGFYDLWTLKEAFSKARGGALVPALGKLDINWRGASEIAATMTAGVDSESATWQFWLFADATHRLALALSHDGIDAEVRVQVRQIDSLQNLDEVVPTGMKLQRWSRQVPVPRAERD